MYKFWSGIRSDSKIDKLSLHGSIIFAENVTQQQYYQEYVRRGREYRTPYILASSQAPPMGEGVVYVRFNMLTV